MPTNFIMPGFAAETEETDPPYPIGYKNKDDFNTEIKIGNIHDKNFEIELKQGNTRFNDHEIESIYDVLNSTNNYSVELDQGVKLDPITGDIKVESGEVSELEFPIEFEIDEIIGRLLFRGRQTSK